MGGFDLRAPALFAALLVLGAGVGLCVLRVGRGPTHFDRVLALDCLVLNVIGGLLITSMLLATDAFIDTVLLTALFGFIGTISVAAYLEGSLAH